jgi:CheY-like chemotaxis protein/HPt (histidine-containing phosphotransfer) domain-containing protein
MEPSPPERLHGARVLVVDRSAVHRGALVEQLEAAMMRVHGVTDTASAVGALEEARRTGDRFAVAIVDSSTAGDEAALDRLAAAGGGTRLLLLASLVERVQPSPDVARVAAVLLKPVGRGALLRALEGASAAPSQGTVPPASAPPAMTFAAGAPRSSGSCAASGRPRVLVVEDSAVNLQVASTMLRRFDCRVDAAANGVEALDMVAAFPYDLVFMDGQMPEMDGFEATAAIRRREREGGGHLIIVAMTAHATQGDRERCLAAGMDDYLSKPVRRDALAAMLERWLGARALALPASDPATNGTSVDREVLRGLRELQNEDEPDFVAEILDLFRQQSLRYIGQLRAAAGTCDREALLRDAHAFKGSARSVGAIRLAELCGRLEETNRGQELRAGPNDGAVELALLPLIDEIERELDRVFEALLSDAGG